MGVEVLRKERKTFGIVQIMVTILELMTAFVMFGDTSKSVLGLFFFMSLVSFAAGTLTVAMGNNPDTTLRKVFAVGANSFSLLLVLLTIVLLALDVDNQSCLPATDPDCNIEEYTKILENLDYAIHMALNYVWMLHMGSCIFYIGSFAKPRNHIAATEQSASNLEAPPETSPPQNTDTFQLN